MKWQDYGNEENTWEPQGNLDHTKEVICEFHDHYPNTVQRLIQIMKKLKEPLTLALQEINGVFKAKTNIRKGYYQDLLLTSMGSHKEGITTWITVG